MQLDVILEQLSQVEVAEMNKHVQIFLYILDCKCPLTSQ